jgi:hypothetical protein
MNVSDFLKQNLKKPKKLEVIIFSRLWWEMKARKWEE